MAKAKVKTKVAKRTRAVAEESAAVTQRLVSLPRGPKVVVEASSDDEAWQLYKQVCGIVQTDHQPTIQVLAEDHDVITNEFGVVIEDASPERQATDEVLAEEE